MEWSYVGHFHGRLGPHRSDPGSLKALKAATFQSSSACMSVKVWGSRARSLEECLVASASIPTVINGLCLQANHWVKCPINQAADKLLGEKCVTLGWAFYVICLKQSCLTSRLTPSLHTVLREERENIPQCWCRRLRDVWGLDLWWRAWPLRVVSMNVILTKARLSLDEWADAFAPNRASSTCCKRKSK